MFEIGDRVVCTEATSPYSRPGLTCGCVYTVKDVGISVIKVVDDTGVATWYAAHRFGSISVGVSDREVCVAMSNLRKESKVKNPMLYQFNAPCVQAVDLAEIAQSCSRENKLLVVKVVEKSKRRSSAVAIHASVFSKAAALDIDPPYHPQEVYATESGETFWVEEKEISEWIKWVKDVDQAAWNEETPATVTVQKIDI